MKKSIAFNGYEIQFIKDNKKASLTYFRNGVWEQKIETSLASQYFPILKAYGNKLYQIFTEDNTKLENFDIYSLDYCILCEDFDSYSDSFKDINHVRPHITEAQWQDIVQHTKKFYGLA